MIKVRKGSILISTVMILMVVLVSIGLLTSSFRLKNKFKEIDYYRIQQDLDVRSIQVLILNYTECVVSEQWSVMSDRSYERVGKLENSSEEQIINDMKGRFYNPTYYTPGFFDTNDWEKRLNFSNLYVELNNIKKIKYINSMGESENRMCFFYSGRWKRENDKFNFSAIINVNCPEIEVKEDKSISKEVEWRSLIISGGVSCIKTN